MVDAQPGAAVVTVVVVEKPIAAGVRGRLVPGTMDAPVSGEDLDAAAGGHGAARAVGVRAGDAGGATGHDSVTYLMRDERRPLMRRPDRSLHARASAAFPIPPSPEGDDPVRRS